MTHSPSNWRGLRSEPGDPVGGFVRERRNGELLGRPAAGSRRRVLVEAFYWLAIVGLGLYAILAPLLPEGGPL